MRHFPGTGHAAFALVATMSLAFGAAAQPAAPTADPALAPPAFSADAAEAPTSGWEEAPPPAALPPPAASAGQPAPPALPPPPPPSALPPDSVYPPPMSPPARVYRYKPGREVPAGYEIEERPRTGLIIAGAITFGVVYGLSSFVAAVNAEGYDADVTNWLYFPVFGPFVAATQVDADCGDYGCDGSSTVAMLVWDGVVQAGGAAMLALGLFVPTRWLVPSPKALSVHVAPMTLGRNAHGVGVTGRF